jgi:RNA polymerase sigma factor (sigma-70 family)
VIETRSNPYFEDLLRDLAPQVLSSVLRRFRDFSSAEDAVQDALIAAATKWPCDGMPENPRAWLTQVAFRRMTDMIRTESARRRRESELILDPALAQPPVEVDLSRQEDDTLVLLFMCCHPTLTPSSAIALTLRAVGGLTTTEIAHAFLMPEATMAQRISRAKQSIRASGVAFSLPTLEEQDQRLRAVLHVLYLIFNEGYMSSTGKPLRRGELTDEAIRLTRMVRHLQPDNPEVIGLLALMLLTDARRLARASAEGDLIPLNQQNRSLWDQQEIAEGVALLNQALAKGSVGQYQLQAAIAAVHDEASHTEETDWPQILALYELLERMSDNPMVKLNRAIAAAMVYGPSHGLSLLLALDADRRLSGHHRLHAARGHLLEMAGDHQAAITHYRLASRGTTSTAERNFLLIQAARLSSTFPEEDETQHR